MMVPMKEHSILSAGELFRSVVTSHRWTRWSWENALLQFLGQILCYLLADI